MPSSPQFARLLALACLLGLAVATAPTARGDVAFAEERNEDDFLETTVVRMTVTPAAEPVPAFKYRLQARDIDLLPGNAAPFYYRALLILTRDVDNLRRKFRQEDELDKWYGTGIDATPVDQLPLDKVRDAVEMSLGGIVGDQLLLATSRRHCSWDIGIEEIRGIDLVYLPLEEFQQSREFARLLAMRTRLAIAERRYADAIRNMRMIYHLAQDFAAAPFLVAGLIGTAEAGVANGTMIELIAAPDSPNMYWALAELPQPIVSLHDAARFETEFGQRMFPLIHNAETTDRSPQEWNRLLTVAVRDLSRAGGEGPHDLNLTGAGLMTTGLALAGYPHAKARLIADGSDRDEVEKMAVGQVMAIYSERMYQLYANDIERIWYVPFSEMGKYDDVDNRLSNGSPFGGGADREVLPIVSLLLPAMQAARAAQVRLERDFAALRVIEALRIYSAANNRRLPESLEAVTQVPIPLNPATGKPFVYRLAGNTAILELPKSDGTPNYQRRFEIQIATNQSKKQE